MIEKQNKTLRLLFPQWQGGNLNAYYLGSLLLDWLAPKHNGPVEKVDVPAPNSEKLPLEQGIVARTQLISQTIQAKKLIEKHQPDRVVVLGGDCLVDLAPFAYLNERYSNDMAILWIDAHPDIMMPKDFQHAHAMVLSNLLGYGDSGFTDVVKQPIKSKNVMYAGLGKTLDVETQFIEQHNLRKASPAELTENSQPVLSWLKDIKVSKVAIHLDLDVLSIQKFNSLYFSKPDVPENAFDGITQGTMSMEQIVRLINDVANQVEIVGLGIAEHLPWDAINLKAMLEKLPLMGINN